MDRVKTVLGKLLRDNKVSFPIVVWSVGSDDDVFKKWMMNSSRRGPKGEPPKLSILSMSIDNTGREMF
jgi:hypothetical protein